MESKVDDAMSKDLINLYYDSMTKKMKIGYLLVTVVVWSFSRKDRFSSNFGYTGI